jgi:hypothetical protein
MPCVGCVNLFPTILPANRRVAYILVRKGHLISNAEPNVW